MNNDVICSSSEIRIAYHKMQRYAENLEQLMQQYIQVLATVQRDAICDDLISARLSEIAEEIRPCIKKLDTLVNSDAALVSNREISEIQAADTFLFPHELLAQISSILASFLGN